MRRLTFTLLALVATLGATGSAWGVRAHDLINRVAVRTLPADGPVFLKAEEDWIAYLASIPDTWRRPSEPFLKILEDPNHGWFMEQFAGIGEIPRSRYGFVIRLDALRRQQAAAGDPAAELTNVRWTGTLPYAAVEGYERMLAAMRRYRALPDGQDRALALREIAFYMGWTGHYTGDGAQPLHDTIHHDGWQGPNPHGYTTDPRVHGRFESQFVDLMQLEAADVQAAVAPARLLDDPFTAILDHLDTAASHVEEVYRLDKGGALADASNAAARRLVIERTASGAALLRDLAYTAWVRSGEPPVPDPDGNPIAPAHPRYAPATGSAPAHRPGAAAPPPGAADGWRPLEMADPVTGKNFYLFDLVARLPAAREALSRPPALAALRDGALERLARAAASCGDQVPCHATAFTWNPGDISAARLAIEGIGRDAGVGALADALRRSGTIDARPAEGDGALVGRAWADAAAGMNRIIEVYALGQAPRYPAIDAVSYEVTTDAYRRLVGNITDVIEDGREGLDLFYSPALAFARRLLEANGRDEAGRHEPLEAGENRAAVARVGGIDWARYPYAVILVPGAGPDRPDVALDPWARLRLELAVARYRDGKAPFIVVSGGYVHPAQTPFAEAIEMKRALMRDYGIPEHAILVDPHARHTTTNLRNTARLLFRYGFPADKPSVVTTDRYQSAYIENPDFGERCARELGYQPAAIGRRLSRFDLEFRPLPASLRADATDPLDP
ncbi:MAG: ElyC/SanA/YdcF family protein [Vicinamibacterales bacterium]